MALWTRPDRTGRLWFGEVQDSNPFRQAPANWPASPIGRGTLPEELESYQRLQASAPPPG